MNSNETLERIDIPAFSSKRVLLGFFLAIYTVIHFKFIHTPYVSLITFISIIPCFNKLVSCPKCKQSINVSPISLNAKCNKCNSVFLVDWNEAKKENLFTEVALPTLWICLVVISLYSLWNFILA